MFSQVDVMLNDVLITASSTTQPYRAVIETLLNYSPQTLESQFSAGLWYKDTGEDEGGREREEGREGEGVGVCHTCQDSDLKIREISYLPCFGFDQTNYVEINPLNSIVDQEV